MSDKDYSVANVMKLYRSLHGMTQEELGEKSGIEYSQVRRYEAGVRKPKLEQLQALSSALGIGLSEFTDTAGGSVGSIVSLLLELDKKTDVNWEGTTDENGDYDPSSIKLSLSDREVASAIALYLKHRDVLRNGKPDNVAIRNEDGSTLTVEELRGIIITNKNNKKKPET